MRRVDWQPGRRADAGLSVLFWMNGRKTGGRTTMMMSNDIGIDLGTASILVYIKGKGVVLKEPSVVAIDRDTNRIMAIGEEARLMIGRTPGNIVAVRPLRQGVISDYTVTEKMLKYFINKAVGKKTLRKPRISVCIPSGATEVERKAVEDATYQAGARDVSIIEEPVAAAIGAGIDISKACGNMIVDIGGGTADIAGSLWEEQLSAPPLRWPEMTLTRRWCAI